MSEVTFESVNRRLREAATLPAGYDKMDALRIGVTWAEEDLARFYSPRTAEAMERAIVRLRLGDRGIGCPRSHRSGGRGVTSPYVPIGMVTQFPVTRDLPLGWLCCDGSKFDAHQYPDLAARLRSDRTPDFGEAGFVNPWGPPNVRALKWRPNTMHWIIFAGSQAELPQ